MLVQQSEVPVSVVKMTHWLLSSEMDWQDTGKIAIL